MDPTPPGGARSAAQPPKVARGLVPAPAAMRKWPTMIDGKKLVVVLPAFNAAGTLELTFNDIPRGLVDEVILVDDRSHDATVEVARKLGISNVHVHPENRGYGANQKTCYRAALDEDAAIVV